MISGTFSTSNYLLTRTHYRDDIFLELAILKKLEKRFFGLFFVASIPVQVDTLEAVETLDYLSDHVRFYHCQNKYYFLQDKHFLYTHLNHSLP